MKLCYVPYQGGAPLVVNINGHDLILIGLDPDVFTESSLLTDYGHSEIGSPDPSEENEAPSSDYEENAFELREYEIQGEGGDQQEESESDFFEESDLDGSDDPSGEDLDGDEPVAGRDYAILGGDDGEPLSLEEQGDYMGILGQPADARFMKQLEKFAHKVAYESGSGVVFVPEAVSLDEVLLSLEGQLPWLH